MAIDVETMETVGDFIFLGSKTIADGGCGHEVKRRLFLGRKAMTNLECCSPWGCNESDMTEKKVN